jgi:hypothetical protein
LVVDLQIASGRKTPIARDQVSETLRNGGIKFDQDLLVETGTKYEVLKARLSVDAIEDATAHLNSILKDLKALKARFAIPKDNSVVYLWRDDLEFTAFRIACDEDGFSAERLFKAQIDLERVRRFSADIFAQMKEVIKILGAGRSATLSEIEPEHKANFVFIRSLLDYASIATSESLELAILDIYHKSPFLFEPSNAFWGKVAENRNLLAVLLLRLSGMFRRSFDSVVGDWIHMIEYLRSSCESDAANFFDATAKKLRLEVSDPLALEKMQLILERGRRLPFAYSRKNGRFMLTLMTKNQRGFDLLKEVTREHLAHFNMAVDSQIVRVSLNTGLIDMKKVHSQTVRIKKKSGEGLLLMRSDLTEPSQRVWKMVSDNVGLLPMEIDLYVWANGSLLCKHFGEYCFVCPFNAACATWETRLVRESRGAEWHRGLFTFCRPQTDVDALILRDEHTPCADQKYAVRTYSKSRDALDLVSLKALLGTSK